MKLIIERGKILTLAVAILSMFMVACSGDDGEEGPTGPAGPTGASGSSNVSANTFTLPSSAWSTGTTKTFDTTMTAITQSVVDGGMVMVFQKGESDTTWSALPYSYNIGVSVGGQAVVARVHLQYSYDAGNLYLTATNNQNFNITNSNNYPGTRDFKVVIVPPANLVKGMDYTDLYSLEAIYDL